jgi:hypothetical protein
MSPRPQHVDEGEPAGRPECSEQLEAQGARHGLLRLHQTLGRPEPRLLQEGDDVGDVGVDHRRLGPRRRDRLGYRQRGDLGVELIPLLGRLDLGPGRRNRGAEDGRGLPRV